MIDIIAQIIGFVGLFFMIISVQFNSHGKIMLFKSLGAFMFVIQYLLLKAYTGAVLDTIGIIRNIIFAEVVKRNKRNTPWIIGFTIFTVCAGALTISLTWSDLVGAMSRWTSSNIIMTVLAVTISILSIIAKSLTTIAYGIKDPHKLRILNFPASFLWLIYNTIYFSIFGIVNELMVMPSIIIAELRFRKDRSIKPTPEQTDEQTD